MSSRICIFLFLSLVLSLFISQSIAQPSDAASPISSTGASNISSSSSGNVIVVNTSSSSGVIELVNSSSSAGVGTVINSSSSTGVGATINSSSSTGVGTRVNFSSSSSGIEIIANHSSSSSSSSGIVPVVNYTSSSSSSYPSYSSSSSSYPSQVANSSSSAGSVVPPPIIIPPGSNSSTGVNNFSSVSSSSSSSSIPYDPYNFYVQCNYVLFPNETVFFISSTNTTSGPKFQLWDNDGSSNAPNKDSAIIQPTIYLRRGFTYTFVADNDSFSFAITSTNPSLSNGIVLTPLGFTYPMVSNSNFTIVADPTGTGLTQWYYDAYNIPSGAFPPSLMGKNIIIADNSSYCPESSTGEAILYPDDNNIGLGNSAASAMISWGAVAVSLLAAVIMAF